MGYIQRPALHPEPDAVDLGDDVLTFLDRFDAPNETLSLDAHALARGVTVPLTHSASRAACLRERAARTSTSSRSVASKVIVTFATSQ